MKRLLGLLLFPMLAWGQVTPTIPPSTVLGNSSGSMAAPSALLNLPLSIGTGGQTNVTQSPFNAKCDGTTDDTVAIQAAINSLSSYGTAIFPPYVSCKITHTVEIANVGIHLVGGGARSTNIDFEPAVTIGTLSITDTTGDFTCVGCSGLAVGETITGTSITWGGSGSITGYSSPKQYIVSATNCVVLACPSGTTLTLQALPATTITFPTALTTVCASPPCAQTGGTWVLAAISAFRFSQGASVNYQSAFIGFSMFSTDTTYTKTALELSDTSAFIMWDVYVGSSGIYWKGGSAIPPDTQAGSIGLRTRGREGALFGRVEFDADRPVVLSKNPNYATNEDTDDFHFWDTGFNNCSTCTTGPLIWVDSGVTPSNLLFDGREGWVGGTYGLYWNSGVTDPASSYALRIENVRWEQDVSGVDMLYIKPNLPLYNLVLINDNNESTDNAGSFYLRNVRGLTANALSYGGTGAAWDLDSTDYYIQWNNAHTDSATATMNVAGQTLVWSHYDNANTSVPANALWDNTTLDATYGFMKGNGIVLGAATGGYEGAGTVNAAGVYVNGTAVSTGGGALTPTSISFANTSSATGNTAGYGITNTVTPTYIDTSAAGGTVALAELFSLPVANLETTTTTTYTAVAELYIPTPTCNTGGGGTPTCSAYYGLYTPANVYLGAGAILGSTQNIFFQSRGFISSPASGNIQLGNTNSATPVAQTLSTQGSRGGTDTNVAGANLIIQSGLGTGNSTGSTLTFKTPHVGSTGTTAETATTQLVLGDNVVQMPALASSSAATTGTVCWTTSTGNLTVDTTVACLSSTRKVKEHIHPLNDGLDTVMALRPVSYDLKPEFNPEHLGHQVGLIAEDVANIDPRLVAVDDKGDPRGVRYMQLTAVLVKAIQDQQHEIEALKKQVAGLKH